MIYVTTDIHGKAGEFRELLHLANFGPDDKLYVLGDVIDRNGEDGGVELLRWIMSQENVEMLLGNHESMALRCGFLFSDSVHPLDWPIVYHRRHTTWLLNGGNNTIEALFGLEREKVNEIYRFLWNLPAYKELTVNGRNFLLVHAGLGNFSPERPLEDYTQKELVWYRPPENQKYFEDKTVICGHTPTWHYGSPRRMYVGDGWIDIDTGAAWEDNHPMLLRLDDLQAFYLD